MHSGTAGLKTAAATRADVSVRPLRVAFFSDAFPERNGTGAYYHDLLAQLTSESVDVRIFQPDPDIKRLFSMAMPGDANQRLVLPNALHISREMREPAPQVVVVVTPGPFGLLGVYYARRIGATLIAAFHTDFEQLAKIYWNPLSRWIVNLVLRTANRIVCNRATRVLINNDGLRTDVYALGARRTSVIGTPLPRKFLQQRRKPIPGRLTHVCFAGRLAPEKNIEKIITAAGELPDIEFVVGGEGPLRKKLEAAAASLKNITFKGWLTRDQLIDVIDESSLLLLPSKFETFGSVALEAMARGRPALVSPSAGIQTWPTLRAGLFTLPEDMTLSQYLRTLDALSAKAWEEKSAAASFAAEHLNNATIHQWESILRRPEQQNVLIQHAGE